MQMENSIQRVGGQLNSTGAAAQCCTSARFCFRYGVARDSSGVPQGKVVGPVLFITVYARIDGVSCEIVK